jgi:hypothetical protein
MKALQIGVGLVVTFWLIHLGQEHPEWESIRNPYAVGVVALLAVLFVSAIPIMCSDLLRVTSRMLHRGRQ